MTKGDNCLYMYRRMFWLRSCNSLSEQKTDDHESAQIRGAQSVHEIVLAQPCIVGVIQGVSATSGAAFDENAELHSESSCQPVASKVVKYEVKNAYNHLPTLRIKFQSGSHHNSKPAR